MKYDDHRTQYSSNKEKNKENTKALTQKNGSLSR